MKLIIVLSLMLITAATYAQSGDLKLKLSMPYINQISTSIDDKGPQSAIGFLGVGIGLKYHTTQKHALSLNCGWVGTSLFPVPAPYDIYGHFTNLNSTYISLSHHYQIRPKINIGYGLNWTKINWSEHYVSYGVQDSLPEFRIDQHHLGAGFNLCTYYHFGPVFSAGLLYHNQIIRFDPSPAITYSHTLSIDLIWQLKLTHFKAKAKKNH